MMKSPTSLIRFRNAVGVMLALSAIFAVVISTISLPSDETAAQTTLTEDQMRAEAWWNSLKGDGPTQPLRANVLLGKAPDGTRDLGDPTRTNTDTGTALTNVEMAQLDFTHADFVTAGYQTIILQYVDGTGNTVASVVNELSMVGGHLTNVQDLRGFQSVEVWWRYLSCAEARIAVGEDNDILEIDSSVLETSNVCDAELNNGGDAIMSTSPKSYSEVKAMADKAGQIILGLDAPGSTDSTNNARAEAWWETLNNCQMTNALWGNGLNSGCTVGTLSDIVDPPSLVNRAEKMYSGLTDADRELVNDRWQWIYNGGAKSDDARADVISWWDGTSCAQMRTAVGVDNEPVASTPNADEYCAMWDGLNPTPDTNGQARQARVLEVGQAILGTAKPVPQVAAWWNTLNADQMVYVVYGNPPMRTAYDPDGDGPMTETVTTVTNADKAVFQKMYDGLAGGIEVTASSTPLSAHLPTIATATTGLLARNGFDVGTPSTDDKGTPDDTLDDTFYYSAKGIVDAIANEIFDPPTMLTAFVRSNGDLVGTSADNDTTTVGPVADDNDFDWPYRSDDGPATVADWWETTDCRVMRIAVGEDNNYLNGAVAAVEGSDDNIDGDFDDENDTAPVPPKMAETSIYCGHFPGSLDAEGNRRAPDGPGILSEAAQKRVVVVGAALLGLSAPKDALHASRPSFNQPPDPNSVPTLSGTAQVGSALTVNTDPIEDVDDEGTSFNYQWLADGDVIVGATEKTYTLQASDIGKAISVRVSYVDGERYPEMITSAATSPITGSPGEVSRIEPGIRGVTVSAGDTVTLSVDVYGLQNVKDNGIGAMFEWTQTSGTNTVDLDGSGREIDFTAPSSPGTYTVTASLGGGECQPETEADRDADCNASITVQVRRPSAPVAVEPEPVNPPGEIPGLIPDSDGNQYEVFTPVEGGTFDGGEGYSINVPSGAVPNGEYIGIRMSDDGAASNLGQTHQRYTLMGNMYGVHAVDASGAAISSYVLEDPAEVCVPLPASARANLSTLSLAAINSDGSLTILAAQAKLNSAGDTMVCGNLSNLPATVAVGAQGAPDAIPTATPVPEPELPITGGTSPASGGLVWVLLLGTAAVVSGTFIVLGRRRKMVQTK